MEPLTPTRPPARGPLARAAGVVALLLAVALSTACTERDPPAPGPGVDAFVELALWPDGTPGQRDDVDGGRSALWVLRPDRPANGTAVLVIPGGGYSMVAVDHEGRRVAAWLAGHAITPFVLRYRHAPAHRAPAPVRDARRAMRVIRSRADEFGIDPARVGAIGFSAGGHLAAMTAVGSVDIEESATDSLASLDARPDFLLLVYPVVSMDAPYAHVESRDFLLGEQPDAELRRAYSPERHVSARTPPTFLVHTRGDPVVPLENALAFHDALSRHGVPSALHVYARGRHGLGLGPPDLPFSDWPRLAASWIADRTSRAPVSVD